MPAHPYMDDEQCKVARDAYVSWNGSRHSVARQYAGKEFWVRDHGPAVEIHYSTKRISASAIYEGRKRERFDNRSGIETSVVETGYHVARTTPLRSAHGSRWLELRRSKIKDRRAQDDESSRSVRAPLS